MKPTYETGFEHMDTILSALLEQVQEMRATLLSAQTSLVALALSNVKPQGQATPLTLVDGQEKHNLKQRITRRQEDLIRARSFQQSLSKRGESQ